MGKNPKVTIIGPGRVGSALAFALREAGIRVDEIVARDAPESLRRARKVARIVGARATTMSRAEFLADVIWLCVGDSAIRPCAGEIVDCTESLKDKVVFHSSGALSSDELEELRDSGASVASVHPMMSFVHAAKPSLTGVTFALEGDPAAVRMARGIIRRLGGEIISIAKEDKGLYHAWGAFASPLIVAELATADRIAQAIGISAHQARKTLAPILRETIENYLAHGPAAAFSGPIVRGDVQTVQHHLSVLRDVPEARGLYIMLARAAVRDLPAGNRDRLTEILSEESESDKSQEGLNRRKDGKKRVGEIRRRR